MNNIAEISCTKKANQKIFMCSNELLSLISTTRVDSIAFQNCFSTYNLRISNVEAIRTCDAFLFGNSIDRVKASTKKMIGAIEKELQDVISLDNL